MSSIIICYLRSWWDNLRNIRNYFLKPASMTATYHINRAHIPTNDESMATMSRNDALILSFCNCFELHAKQIELKNRLIMETQNLLKEQSAYVQMLLELLELHKQLNKAQRLQMIVLQNTLNQNVTKIDAQTQTNCNNFYDSSPTTTTNISPSLDISTSDCNTEGDDDNEDLKYRKADGTFFSIYGYTDACGYIYVPITETRYHKFCKLVENFCKRFPTAEIIYHSQQRRHKHNNNIYVNQRRRHRFQNHGIYNLERRLRDPYNIWTRIKKGLKRQGLQMRVINSCNGIHVSDENINLNYMRIFIQQICQTYK